MYHCFQFRKWLDSSNLSSLYFRWYQWLLWISSDRDQYYLINQKAFKHDAQYLSKKVVTDQIESYSYLNQKSLKKRVDFNFNNDIFDVSNVEVSDSNY